MLGYAIYLQFNKLLNGLSSLTPLLKHGSGDYAAGAEKFLLEFQNFADGQALSVSSDIAVALQKIISYDGKSDTAEGLRRNPRKQRDNNAVRCVEELHEKLKTFIGKYEKTFDESADVCRQIAAQIETFTPGRLSGVDAAEICMDIARKEDALKPYYAHVLGVLGFFNLHAVFQSVLPQIINH